MSAERPARHLVRGGEGGMLGAAGHRHMMVCTHCEHRKAAEDCICPEPCKWADCPVKGDRTDPFDYDKPEVPKFR